MVPRNRVVDMLETVELIGEDREHRLHVPGVPEYRFLKCVERGPLGETWRIRTADHKIRLAQFLPHPAGMASVVRRAPGAHILATDPGR